MDFCTELIEITYSIDVLNIVQLYSAKYKHFSSTYLNIQATEII